MKNYTSILLVSAFICINVSLSAQNKEVVKWLNEHALEIKTTQAEKGFDDLMPLKEILKDKRIVALGEATHGTKEFFEMKHRMLEFLVKEMGFRNFAIEANFTEALVVNDYVMNGIGDPAKALDGLYFWTWDTKEVLAMIKWMRNYNIDKSDKDKVKFYGFDMQVHKVAALEVKKYLLQNDSIFLMGFQDFFSKISELKDEPDSSIRTTYEKNYNRPLESIRKRFETEKAAYISKTSERAYLIALHNLEILAQYFSMSVVKMEEMFMKRDSCMSENVKWLLNFEGTDSKFVLWAHNGHIARNTVDYDGLTMGYHLGNYYKEAYYAIGFDFYTGSFQAVDMNNGLVKFNYTVGLTATGYQFSKSKKKDFFFDFKNALDNENMKTFLNDTMPSICIGAVFSNIDTYNFYIFKPLAQIYDGLIFIRKTSRAEPNTISKRSKPKNQNADFGNMMKSLDLMPYLEKEFRFSAYVKMGKKNKAGRGHLWVRIDNTDNTYGFFENMDKNPIIDKDWKYYEISGKINQEALKIYFGCFLNGKGHLFIDNIKLEIKEGEAWQTVELPDPTFENTETGKKPADWIFYGKKHRFRVTEKNAYEGKKCMEFLK